MEVCKVVLVLSLISSSWTANHSAAVLESSENLKCTLDRPLLVAPALVKEEWKNTTLTDFQQHFLALSSCCGCDLEQYQPPDWKPLPSKLATIEDNTLRSWAQEIHRTWLTLGRKVSISTQEYPERSSLLPLPHPFLLPSFEARELRYWESYWILLALLLGDMHTSSRMLILNLASLITESDFVPGGGRVYLASHSEPPVLAQMLELYYKHTSDLSLVEEILPSLVKEYEFWMRERSIKLSEGTFNFYANLPLSSLNLPTDRDNVRTASRASHKETDETPGCGLSYAESGWRLSTRWSINCARNESYSEQKPFILPVDLNALLGQNELTLYKLHEAVGERKKAKYYLSAHSARCRVFNKIFWNSDKGVWSDVDSLSGAHREGFYSSSMVPLLWGCEQESSRAFSVLQAIRRLGLLDYPGGIPASLSLGNESGWDFPLAIAPLQWFPVTAWHNSKDNSLRTTARVVAQRWVESSYSAWEKHHVLFDKLLSTKVGGPGTGAHTTASQANFGWASGVILHFLTMYPDLKLSSKTRLSDDPSAKQPKSNLSTHPLPHVPSRSILSINPADDAASETFGDDGNSTLPTLVSRGRNYAWIAAPIVMVAAGGILVLCLIWCRWLFVAGETRYWSRVQNEHLQAAGQSGGGGGSRSEEETTRNNRNKEGRESSEEIDEHEDNDRRELFSSFDV